MKGTEVFVHTNAFVERAPGLVLPLVSWRVLHGLDGLIDVESLAARLGIEYPKLATLLEKLQKEGWIEEQVLSLTDFEDYLSKHPASENTPAKTTASSPEPASSTKKPNRVLRLSRIIDFINRLSPTPLAAQATLYLIFSRIPWQLVEREKLTTIHLINDTNIIENNELQEALLAVVYSVVQQRVPDSLFEAR